MPYLAISFSSTAGRILARRDDARDVEPVPMRQVATDQLLNESGHRRGDTTILHARMIGTPAANCFTASDKQLGEVGLFSANPKPLNENRTFPRTETAPGYKSGSGLSDRPQSAQGTSTSGRLAGSLLYSTVRPRQFIVVPLKSNLQKNRRVQRCTHRIDRRPPPQATPLPRCRLRPQPHPTTDNGD